MKTAGYARRLLAIALSLELAITTVPTAALAEALDDAVIPAEEVTEVLAEDSYDGEGTEPTDEVVAEEVDGQDDAVEGEQAPSVDDDGDADPADDEADQEDDSTGEETEPAEEDTVDPEEDPDGEEAEPAEEDTVEPEENPEEADSADEDEAEDVSSDGDVEAEPDAEAQEEADATDGIEIEPVDEEDELHAEADGSDDDELVPLASGKWGSCKWTIEEKNGEITLHIGAGTGEDVNSSNRAPWYPYRESIKKVTTTSIKDANQNIVPLVKLPASSSRLFEDCTYLSEASVRGFDTSNVVDMSYMFSNCPSLTSLSGLTGFNTSKVTNMTHMFAGCSWLESLNLSSFDTSKVNKMGGLFEGCSLLASLELSSSFKTSNVTEMQSMFSGCSSLESLDLSSFNTGKVGVMGSMFNECSSLTSLDLSGFNTSNVTDMEYMFYDCSSLTSLNLSSWDTSSVGYSFAMFEGCISLSTLKVGKDISFTGDGTTTLEIPEYKVNGHSDWWSLATGRWYSAYDITDSRSNRADTYVKSVPSISKAKIASVGDKAYTGGQIKPMPAVKMGSVTLKKGADYTLSYKDNVKVGTATITVTGKGNYSGTKKATFKIVRANIASATVASVGSKAYTGSQIKPTPAVKMGSVTLKKGTDYTLSYKNNVKVGTATITVTGKGNYTGTKSVTFKIVNTSVAKATVSAIEDRVYTGSQIKPTPTVKLGSKTLKKGTDYTLSYKDNVKVGMATVTIKGAGTYTGSKTVTFRIAFMDVPKSHQFYEKIHLAVGAGLIAGYGNERTGDFGPGDNITRAQFAVILWRMAGGKNAKMGASVKDFPDVQKDAYYYDAVRWASSVGVVNGYDNGNFGPKDNITRQQLAVMVTNYASKVGGISTKGSEADYAAVPDASTVSKYARSSVGWCYKKGIFVLQSGRLNPTVNADRATAAQMAYDLYRLLH